MLIGSDTQRGASAIYHGSTRSGWALSVFRVLTALYVQSQRSANIFFSYESSVHLPISFHMCSVYHLEKKQHAGGQDIISTFMHLI